MIIDAKELGYQAINQALREAQTDAKVANCLGQRFIAAGMSDLAVTIEGIPGNALGAYLNGAKITVHGNAQDAVGDTMNNGEIVVHGNVGDAVGYAMRGGKIIVRGDAGYRAGIHMKAYREKVPVIVIGGKAGSFLGEDQAGGVIVVLGLTEDDRRIVGNFPCTGMHGGKVLLRSTCEDVDFPKNVHARRASEDDLLPFIPVIAEYCKAFGLSDKEVLNSPFTLVTPDSKNPYKQMYVQN